MQVEVGPVEAQQVRAWSKCMRRLVIELRLCPEGTGPVIDSDVLNGWTELSEEWAALEAGPEGCLRWSADIEPEKAEFLLSGLVSCANTDFLAHALTDEEKATHKPFTIHVVKTFIDALTKDGNCDHNYLEQVRSSLRMYAESI
jgi:hypothetical protein